jgi:hypothetical protein
MASSSMSQGTLYDVRKQQHQGGLGRVPPSTMKALTAVGDGASVKLKTVPTPKPGPGEVLVKVAVAAQGPPDGMNPALRFSAFRC